MSEEIDIDIEALITSVEARPALWDKTKDVYKDRNATRKAWQEICIELNKNFNHLGEMEKSAFGKEVVKRWTNIRDAFVKSCRKDKQSKKSGAGALKRKKYVYNDQLQFLSKLYFARGAEENFDSEDEGHGADINLDTSSERVDENDNSNPPISIEKTTNLNYRSRRRRKPDEFEIRMLKVLEAEKPNRHLSFFHSVIPALEKFEENEVLQFQMGVLQLISNINEQKRRASQSISMCQPNFYPPSHKLEPPESPSPAHSTSSYNSIDFLGPT